MRNKPRISFSIARAFSWSIFRAARSALRFWLASVLTCTGWNKPTRIICAIPRASLRSLLLTFSIRAVVVKRFQANNSNFCRSRTRASLRDQPLALPAWDQQEETEQSDSRTDRGRAIDTRVQSDLVSYIVPRGTSFRWIVVLSLRQFGVRRSDCRRHFPCPAELGSIPPHAMHNHGEPPCQCDDGFFLPPTLGNVHRPCLQPRPFLHAGQHDLRGLIEQRSHGLIAT